ncbi:MAG: PQQ-binding-like beta-propeller repeat protein [Dactylosporangium sp.]|nr:PQQ-binding-like beta-propeller repeat protein [Dactylosporangium sp.]NNJ61076.1 PQQ-binding-like beta-propeller repeat protein [Dactylosporangium sp.]
MTAGLRDFRTVSLLCVVALTLLIGGGTARAETPFPRTTIPVGEHSGFQLVDGVIYVTDPDREAITAYGANGARRWSAAIRVAPPAARIVGAGKVVLVAEDRLGATATVALDARTGTRLWSVPGRPLRASASAGTATIVVEPAGDGLGQLPEPPSTVRGTDLATGAVLWSYDIGAEVGAMAAWIVRVASPARFEPLGAAIFDVERGDRIVDLTTGAVSAIGDLPVTLIGSLPVRLESVVVAVLPLGPTIQRNRGETVDRWTVLAFQGKTMRQIWSTQMDAGLFAFKQCGRLVCAGNGDQLRAFDPETGGARWRAPWAYAGGAGPRVLAVAAEDDEGGVGTTVGVIDARTGRTLTEFGRWLPVSLIDRPWVALVRATGLPGVAEAATANTTGLRARGMGTFAGDPEQCQADDRYLACPNHGDEIAVWRYRPDTP